MMHSQHNFKCLIPANEAVESMKDLSSNAYKLLILYYSRRSGWSFNDNEVALKLGVTERKFKELRKELIDKEYLFITRGEQPVYFVGRKAVFEWKNPDVQYDERQQ